MTSVLTPELETIILDGIAEGVPLRQLCRDLGVGKSTVYDRMKEDETFAGRFARAREIGFDAIAEEAFEIAEETPQRTPTQFGDKVDPGFVQHQKNRIETRLKLLAKWDPKRYGDRVDLTSSDGTMSPPSLADFYGDLRGGSSANDKGEQ